MSDRFIVRTLRAIAVAALATLMTACGGGGGGGGSPPPPPPPPPPANNVTISGKITFDYVPHDAITGGLNYSQTQARPARLVQVQFVSGTNPLASARTDLNGDYSLSVPPDSMGFIRVRAGSAQGGPPGWSFYVLDNTNNNVIYTLDGAVLSSGTVNSVRDLHAASGWTGSGYGAARAAAPFAILDTLYTTTAYVIAADPGIVLPLMNIYWSPDNISSFGDDGIPDHTTGEIGSSHYSPNGSLNSGIYLLGEENQDSDEYDPHVVAHEFGHYLEDYFGRSDSPGGPHARGDRVDPRLAFSEGWATGFAGLALGNAVYRDAGGPMQAFTSGFNIESTPTSTRGWYSEQSVWELFYDLVDAASNEAHDQVTYPFADVWTVMKGAMVTTRALPTIFPFWRGIEQAHPADEFALDQLTTYNQMVPVADDYGTGETNNANSADVLPVYTPVTFGVSQNLCSTNEFGTGPSGAINKLSSRRFLRFSVPANGTVSISMTATSIPAGEFADPDFLLRRGPAVPAFANGPPSALCMANATGGGNPADCIEARPQITVVPDDYVLEIYEWTNTNDTDDPDYPPIGRTCFDILVTQP